MGILSSLLGIGQSAPTPVAPQTITETQLAKEVAPFMKDLLEKGQALYKQRIDEGYVPFEGQTLAELTPEQLEARTGLKGLVGTQAPQFAKAQELTEGVAQRMTPELTQEYMSPYQQAVTDLDKAEAQKTFERDVLPKVRQAQIGAGAFGGTRGTMLEAQALADQQKLLGDIQTRGSQAAYTDAVRQFQEQKQREGQTGQAIAQLTPSIFKAQTGEMGLLEQIGKEDQTRSQQALDEAYRQYLEERVYPEKTLGAYQSVIAGFPAADITRKIETNIQPQQSGLGSLLGGALNLGNIYGTFGGFSPGGFGSAYTPMGTRRASGGPVLYRYSGGSAGGSGSGGSGGSGGASSYVNPIRYDRPNPTSPAELPTESGLQSVVPSTSIPEQRLSTSELEASNQIALASGQSEFTHQGIRYAANPEGPIPLEEHTRVSNQGIQTPIVMSSEPIPQSMPISTAAPIMAPLLTQEVTGSRTPFLGDSGVVHPAQIPPLDTTPQYFIGKDSPSGPMPIGMPVTPGGPALAGGGLVSLPVVRRAMGRTMMEPGINYDEAYSPYLEEQDEEPEIVDPVQVQPQVQPTIYTPPQAEPSKPLDLSNLTAADLENLSLTDRGTGITSLLYKTILDNERLRQEGKAQDDLDIAAAKEAEERYRGSLKSRAIGDMMGAMARGMKAGAGQGFGGELLSGLGEAAAKSSELGQADVEALEAKDKELRKIQKDARKEWSKGNLETAVALNEVYQSEVDRIIALKNAYLKTAKDKSDVLATLATLHDAGGTAFDAQAKIWFDQGVIDYNDILGITGEGNLPPFLGGATEDSPKYVD
jgi:hypothetical protein